MRARLVVTAVIAAALLPAAGTLAKPAAAGQVTFVSGDASRTAAGNREKLALGSSVFEGDVLETERRTRLEVKLADGSFVRLGPSSRAEVQAAAFGKTVEERKVSAKLVVGKVWANVAKAVGGEQRFEVQTENAVAGVRGTTFRVDAATDRSVVVKVYSGAVAVASGTVPLREHQAEGTTPPAEGKTPPADGKTAPAKGKTAPAKGKPERQQIAGPQQVTREQWEKFVTSMMQVRVSAAGTPSEPEAFALASGGKDEWEEWNRRRDEGR